MITLHYSRQRIKKDFRPIQGIYVEFGLIIGKKIVWINHHGRHMMVMAFAANPAAVGNRKVVRNHNGAYMAMTQDFNRRINRRYGDNTITRMRQNRITDWS